MATILNAKSREDKKPNILRAEGLIPSELYGPDIENQHLALDYNDFIRVYNEVGESSLVDLKSPDGKEYHVLIGEAHKHPISGKYSHVDLRQVSMTQKIEADIELEFIGEAPAVTTLGGMFMAQKNVITINALPKDLVSSLQVDISGLKNFHDKITVGDVKLPAGVEAVDEADSLIAAVLEPRAEEETPAEAVSEADAVAKVEVGGKEDKGEEEASEDKKGDK